MYPLNLTYREKIIEYLTLNQERIKEEVNQIRAEYTYLIERSYTELRLDLEDQYEARIRQMIAFNVSDATMLPIEYVIIEIEKMDMEGYLEL